MVILLSSGLAGLWARPPALLRVGAAYAAKTVCSNVFVAHRAAATVLANDVQAAGHPLLALMRVDVDRPHGAVRAGLFGFIGSGLAVVRPNEGCAVVPAGIDPGSAYAVGPLRRPAVTVLSVPPSMAVPPALAAVLSDPKLAGPGMRAIVVAQGGRVVAERYASGFDARTPQLGWSMTKSVTAGLIGVLVKDGKVRLDQSAGIVGGDRERIRIADLLSMTSGLQFDEGYAAVSDVTRMLYLESDMAAFARSKPRLHPAGAVWSYSSGSAVILARVFQDAVGGDAIRFIKERLFSPLGMSSAVIETDVHGTLVGSSYMYATPRDWATYGSLLAQDGQWESREILPRGFVAMMASPVAASAGEYGQGMVWLRATAGDRTALPPDIFWMAGHDGQFVAVVRSRQLVVVRMGLTPAGLQYQPQPLVAAVLAAVR